LDVGFNEFICKIPIDRDIDVVLVSPAYMEALQIMDALFIGFFKGASVEVELHPEPGFVEMSASFYDGDAFSVDIGGGDDHVEAAGAYSDAVLKEKDDCVKLYGVELMLPLKGDIALHLLMGRLDVVLFIVHDHPFQRVAAFRGFSEDFRVDAGSFLRMDVVDDLCNVGDMPFTNIVTVVVFIEGDVICTDALIFQAFPPSR